MPRPPHIVVACTLLASCVAGPPDESVDASDMGHPRDVADVADAADAPDADGRTDVDVETSLPTRYPPEMVISPVTPFVVDHLQGLEPGARQRNDQTFIKVGASETVNTAFLTCFSDGNGYDLGENTGLAPTIAHFSEVTVDARTSFDRESLAAVVGRTAEWAITGDPESPLEQEVAAMNPRFALVSYGTNDMNQGATHEGALGPFVGDMEALISQLESGGIVPIISGLPPRTDDPTAALWVPTYSAVTRAIAEKHQVPFIDMFQAASTLPDSGRVGDGIHGNASPDGACQLTSDALQFGYNVRNLLTLQTLDLMRRTVLEGDPAPDRATVWPGSGDPEAPFVVDSLPYSHHAATDESPYSLRDGYPSCDDGQDESGPEYYYRLELDEPTPLRIMVFDGPADVDLHLLDSSGDPSSDCVARHHRLIQRQVPAGVWTIVVDTYVSMEGQLAGDYSLVIVECEPGDPTCM